MKTWRAWWQLLRVPNLFTAAADVLAGFLFVGGDLAQWHIPAALMIASMCFYAAGVVLNDVWDADADAINRPDRPIPSGAVSRRSASVAGACLFLPGTAICSLVGGYTTWVGVALAISILAYDRWTKSMAIAPVIMGLCRALNLTLGMSVANEWPDAMHWFAAGGMGLYVTAVTVFARREHQFAGTAHVRLGWVAAATAVAALSALPFVLDRHDPTYRILVGAMFLAVVLVGRTAARTGLPADIQRAVKSYVLGIVTFDACLVWATRGPSSAAIVLLLLVPAIWLGRSVRVT